jgi:hypothetical protein
MVYWLQGIHVGVWIAGECLKSYSEIFVSFCYLVLVALGSPVINGVVGLTSRERSQVDLVV